MDQSLDLFPEEQIIERDDYDSQAKKDRAKEAELARERTEIYRHRCETRSIVRMYREKGGEAVKRYLLQVEKARGTSSSERLRREALEEIQKAKGS